MCIVYVTYHGWTKRAYLHDDVKLFSRRVVIDRQDKLAYVLRKNH